MIKPQNPLKQMPRSPPKNYKASIRQPQKINPARNYSGPIKQPQNTNIPPIKEKTKWQLENIHIAFFVGIGIILLEVITIVLFNLKLVGSLVLTLIFVISYSILLYFLLDPNNLKEGNASPKI